MNRHNLQTKIASLEARMRRNRADFESHHVTHEAQARNDQAQLDALKVQFEKEFAHADPPEIAAARRALASNNAALLRLRITELQAQRNKLKEQADEAAEFGNLDEAKKLWGLRNEWLALINQLEGRIKELTHEQ